MKEEIKRTILKYRDFIPEKICERESQLADISLQKAIVVIGPRRAGKSFLLYDKVKTSKNPILINFEDSLISSIKKEQLNQILDCSKELFGALKFSFFLDEIQNVEGWENFVISLLNEGHKVFITGSNSKLLSKEIATALRGKSLSYLLLPLSFKEFLKFRGFLFKDEDIYSDKRFEYLKLSKDYLTFGGFPEIVLVEQNGLRNKIINSYFESILYKDLVERLSLKNNVLVDTLLKYILNIFGNTFSVTSLENYLKSNKIKYSLEDVYSILKALEDIYFSSYVRQYKKSFKKTELSKSKVYLFDTGFIHFLAREPEDYGRILENLVFIELFRRQDEIENKGIFYFKNESERECDFVIKGEKKISQAIQVCYNLTQDNKKRELDGLLEAMKEFKLNEGTIVTLNQEDSYVLNGKKIIVKPVWKWLLEK